MGVKSEWTFGADKYSAKASKHDLITGDWQASAHLLGEWKPIKEEWKVEAAGHGHSAVFNGVQAWFHVSFLKNLFISVHQDSHLFLSYRNTSSTTTRVNPNSSLA